MADSLDRRLVRAGVKKDVGESLGATWARLKDLVAKAELSDEEKAAVASQLIEDVRDAANEYCDTLRARLKSRIVLGTPSPRETVTNL